MRELSLNVLDIAQNSIVANATLVTVTVTEAEGMLTIAIGDNGCGMTAEQLERIRDPFYTTRTTRRVGMGIPLFRMAAEMAGGTLTIHSEVGVGTTVTASFQLGHIDRMPLGDIVGTMETLIQLNPTIDFLYRHTVNGKSFELDTRSLREVLGDVPLSEPDILEWINGSLTEGIQELGSIA
ncbi:MAG: sensor histidine kinase [Clostridia bacterium]|nr:sensor histidine kinase [Clostridia bacterium]